MFLLSRRFGALADRYGPRWFMTFGPLLVAAGFFALLRLDADTSYLTDLVPALLLYSLGLAVTVAPLTATVLADADEHDAGIASAVNNAVARTAGLLATAAVGAVLAGFYADRLDSELGGRPLTPAAQEQVADGARARAQPGRPGRAAGARSDGGHRGGAGRRRGHVPPRGDPRRADARVRRPARRPAAAQPAPADVGRALPRRPARRRARGGRPRAPPWRSLQPPERRLPLPYSEPWHGLPTTLR